ncbi:hypothetical protein KAR91_88520 [Candidatus Pacearchaeota archaeon]|nr:hypothetical protein [Candidatus Pacearchaeota archaeon]
MAKIHGKGGDVDTGSSVTGMNAWTLSRDAAADETTDFSSGGLKEFIAGLTEWSGTFSGFKDGAPIAPGTTVTLSLEEVADSGTELYTGSAIITNHSPAVEVAGVITYAYTFQGTGALTPAST